MRGYSDKTGEAYVHAVACLARYYNRAPDTLSDEDLRTYLLQLHLKGDKARSPLNAAVGGLRFFYQRVLNRPFTHVERNLPRPREAKRRPPGSGSGAHGADPAGLPALRLGGALPGAGGAAATIPVPAGPEGLLMNAQRATASRAIRPSRFSRAAAGVFLFASASDRAQAAADGQPLPHPGLHQSRAITFQARLLATHTVRLGAGPVFGRYSTL